MQAKCSHFIPPTNFPSLAPPLPAVAKLHSPPKIPHAISISAPESHRDRPPPSQRTTTRDSEAVDSATEAFWDYQFLFMSQRSETNEPITLNLTYGEIPHDFPLGTYYLTGPGLFKDDHGSTVHPLDGHGYLRSFTVCENKNVQGEADEGASCNKEVKFMAKYVKTKAQIEEFDHLTGTWKFTYRGPFSVLRGGKKMGNTKVMKNVANTSVVRWGGRLLCLWEGGEPYEIESGSLDTIGRYGLIDGDDDGSAGNGGHGFSGDIWDIAAGLLKPILYGVFKMPPKRLLSHYKIDARRKRLLVISCNAEDMLLPRSNFTFYEYDSDFKLVQRQEFNIEDHLMIHDWAFTDNHYVLFGNRIKLDVPGSIGAVCGLSPMISALSVNPSKASSPIYLLPRSSDEREAKRDWRVPIEVDSQMWLLHLSNAFEEEDADGNLAIRIHASACSYQWFNFQKMFGYDWQTGKLDPSFMNASRKGDKKVMPRLVEISINMDADVQCQKCTVQTLNRWDGSSDFPTMNMAYSGTKNKYIYSASCSGLRHLLPDFPFDTVVKFDVDDESVRTWSAGPRRFIGEPIFIPKGSEEDDGYLLVIEHAVSIQRCYLVILNPKRIGEFDEVIARLEVPKHLNFPMGFHGFWAAADE